jgi:Cysteine-rich secretory protein family
VAGCNAGDTSSTFKEAVIRRINYYRAMAGLPNVTWTSDSSKAANAQAAALMMAANGQLSHGPPNSWKCYSDAGKSGAGSSNLAGGNDGPDAMDAYMRDNGGNNAPVGHRRWMLYPPRLEMASGDVPNWNALFVFGKTGSRPSSPNFVPYPNPGFFPRPLNSLRWSFSMSGANFANATVSVNQGSSSITANIVHRGGGYGDPSLVWEMPSTAFQNPTNTDQRFDVTLESVVVSGAAKSFSYSVTLVNP